MESGRNVRAMTWLGLVALLVTGTWSVATTGRASAPAAGPRAATESGLEELGTLRWRFVGEAPVRSTPAVAEGRIFFGSAAGAVHALNAETGETVWRRDVGAPVVSSPALADGRLFVASRAALEVLDATDGSIVWRHEFGGDLPLPWGYEGWDYRISSPVVADGVAYVGSGDGHVYALEADDGTPVWSFDVGARVRPTPTITGDTVYVGDSDGIFHALDAATGRERWRFATDGHTLDAAEFGFDRRQIYSAATVAGGVVYFGSRDANLYALDAATGELRWKSNDGTSAWVIGSPVVRGDTVYETRSSSGRARALDVADGTERWRVRTGGPVFAAPVLTGATVLVANELGLLLALDAATGEERWRYGLGGSVWAPPLLRDGRLYVGNDDGAVHAFDGREGPTPRLAVYRDEALAPRAALGRQPGHQVIADWFARRGYERLDAAGLQEFLEARIEDRVPSAVVFAMDALPEPVRRGPGPEASLRRYLEAGGKAVWLGRPPAIVELDAEGEPAAFDRGRTSALLGVDAGPFTGDVYHVRPTGEGRARGLETWWTAGPTVRRGPDIVPLGVDELGQVSAWERGYGGPEGTGFVSLYPTTDTGRLDEIRAVTEYGIFRSPVTRELEPR